jgi:hypothetical protein
MVFFATAAAWLVLGGVTKLRTDDQGEKLRGSVQSLWGNPQLQRAPVLTFRHATIEPVTRIETKDGREVTVREEVRSEHERVVSVGSSDIDVALRSDLRRKGLSWYSLYDVNFSGVYVYEHRADQAGQLEVVLALPDDGAIYDDFELTVSGADVQAALDTDAGAPSRVVSVAPGQRVEIRARYRSRGLDSWQYAPTQGAGRIERFALRMTTDFADIDFPPGTLSPSSRERAGQGWAIDWSFSSVVTGSGIGMRTPMRLQPGQLAAELSLTAPISLFFFFLVLFVLATLRDVDLHPINYAFLAGAFFAFHLLFAYSADHLAVEAAFALSSVVSVFLVLSYLRLVVSPRFAYVEAGLAQLVYLVGFSLAHFWEGYTGLTTTVLAIVTLFALMQLTGRLRWSDVLRQPPAGHSPGATRVAESPARG